MEKLKNMLEVVLERRKKMIKLEEINPKNVWAFFSGYFRYHLHYRFPLLYLLFIRRHIREQITYRINSTNKQCLEQGSCIHCGCAVTALQHASKTCGGICYPEMIGRRRWSKLKEKGMIAKYKAHGYNWEVDHSKKMFFIVEYVEKHGN